MTRVPISPATFDRGYLSPNLNLYTNPDYAHWDMATALNMGLTAEKLLSQTSYTREDMDRWAERSHTRAVRAREDGFFDSEILSLKALQADGHTLTVKTDQAVRADVSYEELAALKPAFKKDGSVTAGTSSPLNAGASAMILMSRDKAEQKGIRPMAVIRSIGFAGVDPTIMGHGPVPASQKALAALEMSPEKIDFWEINEAFAIVVLNCIQALGLDPDRVNVTGGGLAIGHPLGASGIRLVGTLARILAEKGARWGCANACCGGGQGVATVIEHVAN
jgi:acetyl-CoA C-acetyltransferase